MKTIRTMLLASVIAVLATVSAFGQGGYYRAQAPQQVMNYSGTVYYVGTFAATGTPLSPTQTIYSDHALSSSISQASGVTLPASGNVEFYAQPGVYQIQFYNANMPSTYVTQIIIVPPDGNTATNAGTDGYLFVSATACMSSVSGNSTGTNGLTVAGASNTTVIQAQTSATGTNTHTYVCNIPLSSRLTTGKPAKIADVTFMYGVQSNAIGTQAATLASGTMNGSTVFSSITYPAAGASETASTVTPVRADSGSLVITPAVASFNTATTTAGAFYSVKFAPAAAISVGTDLQQLLLTVTLQCSATTATITNSPGFIVHYTIPSL